MMRLIFGFLLCLVPVYAGQFTVRDLKKEYARIFQAEVHEYNGRKFDGKKVTKLPQDHVLANFVNDNYWLIHYLQTTRDRHRSRGFEHSHGGTGET